MTKEQMKEALEDVELIEADFGRKLTVEESTLVVEKGFRALLDKLGMDDNDYRTMRRIFALITAGYTESDKRYDEELEKENYQALDVLKSLVNDLEATAEEKIRAQIKGGKGTRIYHKMEDVGYHEENDEGLNKYFTPEAEEEAKASAPCYIPENDEELNKRFSEIPEFITRLVMGDTVQLTDEELGQVYDYLADKGSYSIMSINGLTKLKL